MSKIPNSVKCLDVRWKGHADCQHCAIRKHDIFADINIKKYEKLLKRIIQFSHAEKSLVYVEHSPAEFVYVVRKGMIKLEETLQDGNARIVRLVNKTGVAGLEAFLNHQTRYDQTAIAVRDSEICRIPHAVLQEILDQDLVFYKTVMQEWHCQLEASSRVVVEFSTGTLKQRIARVLLFLIKDAKDKNDPDIRMLHIDDIAALTGSTRESVSRIMAEFKREKLLKKSCPNKMFYAEQALREIAGLN